MRQLVWAAGMSGGAEHVPLLDEGGVEEDEMPQAAQSGCPAPRSEPLSTQSAETVRLGAFCAALLANYLLVRMSALAGLPSDAVRAWSAADVSGKHL